MKTENLHQYLCRPVIVATALYTLSLWPVSAQKTVQQPVPINLGGPTTAPSTSVSSGRTAERAVVVDSCLFDAEPPTVDASVDKDLLWPPNHDLIDVGLRIQASDNCELRDVLVNVYADEDDEEPTGDGHHSPDAKYENGVLRLRAERKGDSDGRVYLIVVTAIDRSGNVGHDCVTVVVPKSQSPHDLKSVQEQAAAAELWCLAFGTPPRGYVPVGDGPVLGPKQ